MSIILRGEALEAHVALLTDESRVTGTAAGVALPSCEEDLIRVVEECHGAKEALTPSAGLTGITAGGVPHGGVVVNFGRMNRVLGVFRCGDEWRLRCEPGVVLGDLREGLARGQFEGSEKWPEVSRADLAALAEGPAQVFPPDPTEWSACLGGMVACNASGARSFHYGPTRPYISALRGVLVDGRSFSLARGEVAVDGERSFTLPLTNGESLRGTVPPYTMPTVKNAAGYYAADGMDLVDLFIGSEGTLCLFSEFELRLVPAPEHVVGVVCFLPSETAALGFVRALRGENELEMPLAPLALEFFDHCALDLLRAVGAGGGPGVEVPELPPAWHTAVYVEFGGAEDAVDEATMALCEAMAAAGGDEDATWIASEPHEHERLKTFRHLVPETINTRIGEYRRACPAITKLGTDMAVPGEHLETIFGLYREALEPTGLEHVIFGHIGDNHVHVNILPKNEQEYATGKAVYERFAAEAVRLGGTISAEHGVGKLKAWLLPIMYGEEGVAAMRATKAAFDPDGRLNRDAVFPWEV